MPRLIIIQATGYRYRGRRIPNKIRKRKLVGAVMPYLAALAPPEWKITLVDDAVEDVDYTAPADAVAITVRTVTSIRAYDIADEFRRRGVPVLMGGPHATFHADEMAEHADAVCIGEAEEVFPRMLEDAAAGRLQRFYRRETVADLGGLPIPRWDLLNLRHYTFYKPWVIQYSRGCPYRCDFCAEWRLNGDHDYRYRPKEEVVEEIKRCGSRHVFFAASQFAGNPQRTIDFMEALIPLKIHWSALFSPRFCLDERFLDVARNSGLLHVNMGLESIDQTTLNSWSKGFNKIHSYETIIHNLRKRDISYSFNFVFGSDEEDKDVFRSTLRFLNEHKVPAAYFNLMAPLRGTPLYERMKAEGRLIDEDSMERWPGVVCHFRPLRYTPEELVDAVSSAHREFYSLRSALRRLPLPTSYSRLASWKVNFDQMKVGANLNTMQEFSDF